ncbi:hypothetical protein HYC85_001327 [Camellia sinensis]|uniref:Disease resistance R13L4/SHOC-2-like LRR domain-containing protein n=1 Tax=Camellia sinensis TaxID=4442 RepID=A0A7J7I7K2_CAMSI|nr:hypothetical protein HYC85_001327 [Camellia sinensis]
MASIPNPNPSPAYVEAIEEIMKAYKSLLPRPTIEEVEAATSLLKTVETEHQSRLSEISLHVAPPEVPPELFSVLQQVRKTMALFQSHEQKKEATHLVELDEMFQTFDELIQRASELVFGTTQIEKSVDLGDPVGEIGREGVIERRVFGESVIDESSSIMAKTDDDFKYSVLMSSSSTKATDFTSGEYNEKLSLMQVAALIEKSAKRGAVVLDLQGKLMEKIEWLPVSLGKLLNVHEINVSENRIMALPSSIGNLTALTKLDVHSNQLINLPESIGELVNLTDLDLHANLLKSLPPSFGNLTKLANLDLSSNHFTHLPDVIGELTSLKKLNAETNDLEDVPYTIGVKGLPTTMGNLLNLRELDVSFNELESIPESLCFAVNLVKLNVGKNFADLRALPRSIGNLEMLEELDISDDQIRELPDSFKFLSKLRVFRADETPLEVPPRHVTALGAQAVVQYMADFATKKDVMFLQLKKKKKGFWSRLCPFFCH